PEQVHARRRRPGPRRALVRGRTRLGPPRPALAGARWNPGRVAGCHAPVLPVAARAEPGGGRPPLAARPAARGRRAPGARGQRVVGRPVATAVSPQRPAACRPGFPRPGRPTAAGLRRPGRIRELTRFPRFFPSRRSLMARMLPVCALVFLIPWVARADEAPA